MAKGKGWSGAANVLCVRLDALGDVLMTTPALQALKESHPGRRLTLLTSSAGAEAAALVPKIDGVIVYDAPWMKATGPRADSSPEYAMTERLRRGRFDAAVVFTVHSQNPLPAAFLCFLADIPLRLAHCHENPYQLLTDWVRDPEPAEVVRHEVRRQLDLVAAVGCRTSDERMALRVPAPARQRVERLLRALPLDPRRPWVVVHPGASAPSRRYPPEYFAAAARQLALEDGWQIVFTGSDAERGLVDGVRALAGVPCHSLAGRLDLAELAALLASCPLLMSNNTGPVHVAAAVGTPVVDLYALTNPQHTPWAVPHRVLNYDVPCKNCYKSVCPEGHHDCLRRVPPEAVAAAARDLLHETHTLRTKPDGNPPMPGPSLGSDLAPDRRPTHAENLKSHSGTKTQAPI
jgi:lipopolysaccharide heptosyltransferase II